MREAKEQEKLQKLIIKVTVSRGGCRQTSVVPPAWLSGCVWYRPRRIG